MTSEERKSLIDQLERSFEEMPRWAQVATKHAMGAPTVSPETGQPFKTFREVIETASDDTLITLRDEFDDNGDLLPAEADQPVKRGA